MLLQPAAGGIKHVPCEPSGRGLRTPEPRHLWIAPRALFSFAGFASCLFCWRRSQLSVWLMPSPVSPLGKPLLLMGLVWGTWPFRTIIAWQVAVVLCWPGPGHALIPAPSLTHTGNQVRQRQVWFLKENEMFCRCLWMGDMDPELANQHPHHGEAQMPCIMRYMCYKHQHPQHHRGRGAELTFWL